MGPSVSKSIVAIGTHEHPPSFFRSMPEDVRFWSRVQKTPDCWLWQGPRNKANCGKEPLSYGTIAFRGNRTCRAHRAAWILTYGEIPAGMYVCHRCDNPQCVRPSHLFLGTPKDNAHDMKQKGRWYNNFANNPYPHRGEESGTHKLTNKDVLKIRKLRALRDDSRRGGHVWTLQELADKFRVSKKLILLVTQNRIWQHI
jgi:HNH endonuclease